MRSTEVQPARNLYSQLYNALRADAGAASWLLPHQQAGCFSLPANPTDGQTVTAAVNGTNVVATFVATLGITPNSVLIGADALATAANLAGWLRSPNVTNATQVAASSADCQLLSYVEWKQVGTTITACPLNSGAYAPLTSFSGSTTATSGTYAAAAMQLYVERGQFLLNGTRVAFAGGSSPTVTAPVSNPRIDLLTIDSTGTLALVTGAEAASPAVPAYPKNKVTLCEIYNVVGETSITDNANQLSGQGYVQYDVRNFVVNTDVKVSQSAAEITGTDTGGANAYAIAPSPAIAAYAAGQVFTFIVAHANTGGSTFAVSGLSAVTVMKYGAQALAAGDMAAGMSASLQFDGTYFQLLNPATPNVPPQGLSVPMAAYNGSVSGFATYCQFGGGVAGLAGTVQASAANATSAVTNIIGAQLTMDTVANVPSVDGEGWSVPSTSLPATSSGAMLSHVPYSSTLLYSFGNSSGAYTGSYYISGSFFHAVVFSGSPPAPTAGVPPLAFTDGTYLYVAQSAGVYSKFSVSGYTLTYAATVTYAGMASGSQPWTDGTDVYAFNGSGLAKWPLAGGSATQYGGIAGGNAGQAYAVGVSQSSPWLAVVAMTPAVASSGTTYAGFVLCTVTYVPKF